MRRCIDVLITPYDYDYVIILHPVAAADAVAHAEI